MSADEKTSLIIIRTRWDTYLVSDRLREGAEVKVLLGVDRRARGMVDTQPEVDPTADSRTSEAHHSHVFWRVQLNRTERSVVKVHLAAAGG